MKTFLQYQLRRIPYLFIAIINKFAYIFNDKQILKLKFLILMHSKLNLKNPKTFNEKLQWLKLYNRCPEYTTMVDKHAVKKYIAESIGEEYIIPTLGVWNTVDEIEWETLPNQFVIKTTHYGGGLGVIICKDKKSFNKSKAIKSLSRALKADLYYTLREWPYKNVPKKIIAEQYMVDESGQELKDYKFFCFNGRVECFKVDFNRFSLHRANYYDRDARMLPFGEIACPADHSKLLNIPTNIGKMIELAEKLAKDIPFVRIDFYNIKGKIYFGEITFFPASGLGKFKPNEWDFILGEKLVINL